MLTRFQQIEAFAIFENTSTQQFAATISFRKARFH